MRRCCEQIFGDFTFHQCSRTGSIEREGKWYCKIHDPIAKAERDKARRDKWGKEWTDKQEALKSAQSLQNKKDQVYDLLVKHFPDDPLEGLKKLLES